MGWSLGIGQRSKYMEQGEINMIRKVFFKYIYVGLFGLVVLATISLYIIHRASISPLDTRHLFKDELTDYIIPQRPSSQILPGTIISYIDGKEFVEASSEICFGSDKVTVRTAETLFQSKSYSTNINTGLGLWFFKKIFSNSSKDQIKLVSTGVSDVSIKFGDAKIDYIELGIIRNIINAIDTSKLCRSALKNGSIMIVETITVSSAEINIAQTVSDKESIEAEWNSKTGLSANGEISRIGKANLNMKSPLSIGYKAVSLESLSVRGAVQVVQRPLDYYYSLRETTYDEGFLGEYFFKK